jgi:hypothetical protein
VIVYDDDGNPITVESPEAWSADGPGWDWAADLVEPFDEGYPELEDEDPEIERAETAAQRQARHDLARRVHVAPAPPDRVYRRLSGEFDPRGRHVGCDGDETGGGCGAAPGVACRMPRDRSAPPGFVHPSRLASERMLFGIEPVDATTPSV